MSARYEDVRLSCLDGDLVAFGGKWALSRAIQWWTRSEVSHLGVLLWIDAGEGSPRLCVMESVGGGVRLFPFSSLNRSYHKAGGRIWLARYEGPEPRQTIRARALTAWGSAYPSDRQYLAVMFRWARWLWGSDVDPEAYTCSEFAAHCYGLPEPALKTPRQVIEWRVPILQGHGVLSSLVVHSKPMFGPLTEVEEPCGPFPSTSR